MNIVDTGPLASHSLIMPKCWKEETIQARPGVTYLQFSAQEAEARKVPGLGKLIVINDVASQNESMGYELGKLHDNECRKMSSPVY